MTKGRKISQGRYGKKYSHILTKEYLLEEYVKNKKSPYRIANDVDCSAKTVYDYIDYYKIERINRKGHIQPGQMFGILTTVKIVGKTKNSTYNWLCKCDCGNEVTVPTSRLKCGRVKSCGCYTKRKKYNSPIYKGYCDITGTRVCDIRYRARKKNMEFDLDAKYLWELLQYQKEKCALTGLEIEIDKNASLDRKDSAKGYIKGNVWWVHRDINVMKSNLKLDHFIKMCQHVNSYYKETK